MESVDFNLLPKLQALLELKNVSQAAERLQLSQPATSAALAKLRRHFNDELLVRVGRYYELSSLAEELLPLVNDALKSIARATGIRSAFDPAASERTFVVAASDYAVTMMMKPLRRILQAEAPNVAVRFLPTSTIRLDRAESSAIDLIVGPSGYSMPGRKRYVFRDSFVAIMDKDHPLLEQDEVAIEDLMAYPHAVGHFGDNVSTPIDYLFDELGLQRHVVAHINGLMALPTTVEGTNLITFVPHMLAALSMRSGELAYMVFPPEHEAPLVEAMLWRPSRSEDPANMWLRSVIQRACSQLHKIVQDGPEPARELTLGSLPVSE